MGLEIILLLALVPFIFVVFIVPHVAKLAHAIGAVDKPNKRKVHQNIMPSMGGLAIFMGFTLGFVLFSRVILYSGDLTPGTETANLFRIIANYKKLVSIFLASFIIIITGIVDDVAEIRAKVKLIGQIAAAMIIVFYGDIMFDGFNVWIFSINNYYISAFASVLWIVAITNAINLIDGLDGLASGISLIYFFTIAVIALFAKYYDPILQETFHIRDTFTASISLIMLGSTGGFLVHNFNPAKIFLGDTGALFLGLIISVLPLLGFTNVTFLTLFVPLLILAVPLLDMIFAILRRLLKGAKIHEADKDHIHHQLFNMKFGHRNTVLVMYTISSLFSVVAIIFSMNGKRAGLILFAVLTVIIIIFIEKTSILTEKFKPITHITMGVKSLFKR